METAHPEIAHRFVELIRRTHVRSHAARLSGEDIGTLCVLLSAAGYPPTDIIPGELNTHYQERKSPGTQTHTVNKVSQLIVYRHKKVDHFATGWLDCMFRLVMESLAESDAVLSSEVSMRIRDSAPLAPIRFTREGDMLIEVPPKPRVLHARAYFVRHTHDGDTVSSRVGIHEYCTGVIERRGATAAHDALVCHECYVRALFPRRIRTYAELRAFLVSQTGGPIEWSRMRSS